MPTKNELEKENKELKDKLNSLKSKISSEVSKSPWASYIYILSFLPVWLRIPILIFSLFLVVGLSVYAFNSKSVNTFFYKLILTTQKELEFDQAHQDQIFIKNEINHIDLSMWQPVDSTQKGKRISPERRNISLNMIRRSEIVRFFITDIFTSSNPDPDFVCITHDYKFQQVDYTPDVGSPALKKYQGLIDISNSPIDKPFDIKFQYIVWNTRRGLTQSWAEIGIYHETEHAEFIIDFANENPAQKPFKYSKAPINRAARDHLFEASLTTEFKSGRFRWILDDNLLQNKTRYRVEWLWEY